MLINLLDKIKNICVKIVNKKNVSVSHMTQQMKTFVKDVNRFYVYKDGVLLREYSTDIHGELAEQLANQFAIKINGIVK